VVGFVYPCPFFLPFTLFFFPSSRYIPWKLGRRQKRKKEKEKKEGDALFLSFLSGAALSLSLSLSLSRSVLFSGFRFWLRRSGQLALVMKTFAEIVVVVFVFFKT
jgi:hypothetical protein